MQVFHRHINDPRCVKQPINIPIIKQQGDTNMNEYEVFIEDINSCGGEQYAKKELIEVEADSPESYVKANGRFPIIDISQNANGDTVILTGDGVGNMLRYTFSEC
jgi:hypothetical protein